MNPSLLTERGWTVIASKFQVEDNGLEDSLSEFEELEKDEHDEKLKCLKSICQFALTLKRSKELAAKPAAVKYLNDVFNAGQAEQREVLKQKTGAANAAKAAAVQQQKEDKEEELEGNYAMRLTAALQKLKSSRGLVYPFIICEGKPVWGVSLARQITPMHKAELLKVVEGAGKRFFPGECKFEDGKYEFIMERPMAGLARKLQDSIKFYTG